MLFVRLRKCKRKFLIRKFEDGIKCLPKLSIEFLDVFPAFILRKVGKMGGLEGIYSRHVFHVTGIQIIYHLKTILGVGPSPIEKQKRCYHLRGLICV